MRPFIVGIAGGTASGKTTIAQQIAQAGGSDRVVVVALDRYYRSQAHIRPEQRTAINYDHPDALEFELLISHLKQLQSGIAIDAPLYDFASHSRDPHHTTRIEPKPVIVVEGILVLANTELCTLLDLKVFVATPDRIRLARRTERDTEQRGRSIESVNSQWNDSVQPMHQVFCEPSRALADIVVDGCDNPETTGNSLWITVWQRAQRRLSPDCEVL
jgi:uridine kinase